MSIIQDALRRKAEELGGAGGGAAAPPPAAPPPPAPRNSGPPWRAMGVAILVFLALLLAGLELLAGSVRRWSRARSAPTAQPAAPAPPSNRVEFSEPPETPPLEAPEKDAAAAASIAAAPAGAVERPAEPPAPADMPSALPPPPSDVEPASSPPAEVSAPPAAIAAAAAAAVWPRIELQGVIVRRDGKPSTALINDRRVRVGESFEGVRLISADDEEALFEYRGERRSLRIGGAFE